MLLFVFVFLKKKMEVRAIVIYKEVRVIGRQLASRS